MTVKTLMNVSKTTTTTTQSMYPLSNMKQLKLILLLNELSLIINC